MSKIESKDFFEFNDKWPIIQGPREKNEATQHLEYIVYSYLLSSNSIKFTLNDNKDIVAKIDDIKFNLTQILKFADFEHFSFTKQALDLFETISAPQVSKDVYEMLKKTDLYLHMSEKIALNYWTRTHTPMQHLLLFNKVENLEEIGFNLALICIACHGLSKSYSLNKPSTIANRVEKEEKEVLSLERKEKNSKKELMVNKGFTAAALGQYYSANMENYLKRIDIFTYFSNPGPNISFLSAFPEERECLYPPNTEFKYQYLDTIHKMKNKKKKKYQLWQAEAYRSLNSQQDYKYSHEVKIEEILKKKILIKIDMLFNFLLKEKIQNTHSSLRALFFDVVDNRKKIECINIVIDEMKKFYTESSTTSQMNDTSRKLIQTILTSIEKNKRIVTEVNAKKILKASLGKTHDCLIAALETTQQILTDLTILDLISNNEEKSRSISITASSSVT